MTENTHLVRIILDINNQTTEDLEKFSDTHGYEPDDEVMSDMVILMTDCKQYELCELAEKLVRLNRISLIMEQLPENASLLVLPCFS